MIAALASFFVWIGTPIKERQCEDVIAKMTQCIWAVRNAPEQCGACVREARERSLRLHLDPHECGGIDSGEHNRSCF